MRRNTAFVIGLALLLLLLALGVVVVMSEDPEAPPAVADVDPEEAVRTKGRVKKRSGSRAGKRDGAGGGKRKPGAGTGTRKGDGSGAGGSSGGTGTKPQGEESEAGKPKPPSPKEPEPETGAETSPQDPDDPNLPPKRVGGVVLDGATGEPIAKARVLYVMVDEKGGENWFGGTTDAEGRFSAGGWKPEQLAAGGTPEIRIRADGFRVHIAPVGEATLEVRLEALDQPPLPGHIEGNVLGADAEPYHGRLAIVGHDAFGNNMHQWVTTDPQGAFRMESMPAGRWRVGPFGTTLQIVVVPEDDTVRVSFELDKAPQDSETVPAEMRAVTIEGIPDDVAAGASIRAELRARHFWRATVNYGRAEFASLPIGNWTFVLEQPGQPDRTVAAAVTAGDEPRVVSLAR